MFRKIVFVALTVFLTIPHALAQKVQFGVFADPLISWMKTDISRIKGDGTVMGINFGLSVDNYFQEHYAFSSGISLHQMGGILNYTQGKVLKTSDGDVTLLPGTRVQYHLQYLHVPLALKFKTSQIGYTTFFARLGLDPMVNVKSRATIKDMNISKTGVNKEINLLYMAYHVSAGIEYNIVGNTSLVAGVTYMNGFTDVTDDTSERTFMHNIEFRIGINF